MTDFFSALGKAMRRHGLAAVLLPLIVAALGWAFNQWAGEWVAKVIESVTCTMRDWNLRSPASAAVIYCAAFVAFCAIIATRDELLRKYVEFVREPDIPALDIIWKPGEKTFHYPYTLPNDPDKKVNLQYRICIVNISKRTKIENIEVKLDELDPHVLPCVPCHLRLMNNILPVQEPIESFSLNPGDRKFIDLMVQWPGGDKFWILHTVTLISVLVDAQPYKLRVVATSDHNIKVSKNYQISKEGIYWSMQEVPNA